MKIFFSNIETEEKTVDGEVLGELDQVKKRLILIEKWNYEHLFVFSYVKKFVYMGTIVLQKSRNLFIVTWLCVSWHNSWSQKMQRLSAL